MAKRYQHQQDGATSHTAEAKLDVLRPVSEDRNISRRADKDKCYADKPETIDVLKENIREAIGKIQLHTIDNMIKIGLIM